MDSCLHSRCNITTSGTDFFTPIIVEFLLKKFYKFSFIVPIMSCPYICFEISLKAAK